MTGQYNPQAGFSSAVSSVSAVFVPQNNTRICLPVPLFHCFGSVMGGMSMAVHGASLIFPSAVYSSKANLAAIASER